MYVAVVAYILAVLFLLAHVHLLCLDLSVAIRRSLIGVILGVSAVKIILFVLHFAV